MGENIEKKINSDFFRNGMTSKLNGSSGNLESEKTTYANLPDEPILNSTVFLAETLCNCGLLFLTYSLILLHAL